MKQPLGFAFPSALACAAAVSGFSATAAEVAPDAVTIADMVVATPLTDIPGDPVNGRAVTASRKLGNCLACHVVSEQPKELFQGDVGPSLDGVGDRYAPEQLRAILVDSKQVFTDTVMPGFYTLEVGVNVAEEFKGKTILSAQEVEDVVAYLSMLK